MTRARHWPYWSHLMAAAIIGVAEPHVALKWKCRSGQEQTEACVWGKSYLPVTRVVMPIVITPLAFVLIIAVTRAFRRRKP